MQNKSFVWGAVLLVGMSWGCGGITQPLGELEQGGTGGAGPSGGPMSSSGGASPAHACETQCFLDILAKNAASCKLCHAGQPAPAGLQSAGLDLQNPNVTARLKDVPAKHTDLAQGMTAESAGCPVGDKLIDTAAPENSWLLKKLKGQQGNCGTQMPQPPTTLRFDELACAETYVHCVAGK